MNEGEGIVLEIREYGNTSLIIKFLTPEGKISGFIKGGFNRKQKLDIFSHISFKLNKRLEEHLGVLKLEVIKSFSSTMLKSRLKVKILCCVQEALIFLFQDADLNKELYNKTYQFLEVMENETENFALIALYLNFEMRLLSILGFGLDFTKCALGTKDDLFFISPTTGRCCSFKAGMKFQNKLFEIPAIYGNKRIIDKNLDLKNAFEINSHFFKNIASFEKLNARKKILDSKV